MNLLIVSTPELSRKAISLLDQTQWRVVVPSLFSDTWLASGNDLPITTLKQYLPRFDNIYIEEGLKIEAITLLQHTIDTLGISEYYLCDFESIDDINDSIVNGSFVDKNHANAKYAEYMINSMFINRLSKAIKAEAIKERAESLKQTSRVNYAEINNLTKIWHKQLQNYFVLLPTLAGLSHIVKAERTIMEYDPIKVRKIYVQYKKDDIEFTVVFKATYTEEYTQECNDTVEYLRNPSNKHVVNFYQNESKEVKPFKANSLSTLQSQMFYLYHFNIEYTTKLAKRLNLAGLITNPLTSSQKVPYEAAINIIRYLNNAYEDGYVLQHQREYKELANDVGVAIIPTQFGEMYTPENIDQTVEFTNIPFDGIKMRNDALLMYRFIFATTEWTQMNDAIYDNSSLQIQVGNKKLEVSAHSLLDIYDPEKGENVEQKCWKMVNSKLNFRTKISVKNTQKALVFDPHINKFHIYLQTA